MFYALCNKVHNFGTCKHHGTRFTNRLFMKLIILYKPLLNGSHPKTVSKWHYLIFQKIVYDEFVHMGHGSLLLQNHLFKIQTSSITMKPLWFILCKCEKLRLYMAKSKVILFKD
jgi:hypothetical protein